MLIVPVLWPAVFSFYVYAKYLMVKLEKERWQFERDLEAHREWERQRREEQEKLEYRQTPMYWQPPNREKCVQYATRK